MDLMDLLQAIPQELYDMIYEFTFTPDPSDFAIDAYYRPSNLLRVDRTSRRLFALNLYGTCFPFKSLVVSPQFGQISGIFLGKGVAAVPELRIEIVQANNN